VFRLMPDVDTLTLRSLVVPMTRLMCSFLLLQHLYGVAIFELELINFIPVKKNVIPPIPIFNLTDNTSNSVL